MKRTMIFSLILFSMIMSLYCGPKYVKVMIPPKIDLKQHEVIGIIDFDCTNKGKLGPLTTERFMEAIRVDQGMVRIIKLGSKKQVLKAIRSNKFNAAAFKAIGEKYEVNTIFIGNLVISDIRPDVEITSGLTMRINADVDATLAVEMFETVTGASIWNRSASASENIGGVSLSAGRHFAFDADDPDKAYGNLVNDLVYWTTEEYRVTWTRRRVE
ncbi:hypothetical protein AMJ74_02470 [candidate division WOR_3 bacterium SM1_77]|uniref:Uncharacterized protein n=1 Tax=candidate division WOR_3 bacterium SM1_77 TaxID=1703778 RepID=A0A0S8JZJ2_UNCW3|nr:MAG: hypothetical protein AMJ74_02470 [candidate division WOR_3 bacterium SM1_77]